MSRMFSAGGRLRIGLVGAGMISAFHLKAWAKQSNAEIIAICDPDTERASARAHAFGITHVYDDAKRMIADSRPDAIDIVTPLETHGALVKVAAEHSLDAMCQKPLAASHGEAAALLADIAGRVRLMVHENWRFRSNYRLVRQWMDQERLGRIQQCHLRAMSSGLVRDAEASLSALVREPSLATSTHLTIGTLLIHHLDVLRFLLGELEVDTAIAGNDVAEVAAETWATILLRTSGGRPVVLEGNMAVPGAPTYIDDAFTIVGTRATVSFSNGVLRLAGDGRDEEHVFRQDDLYQSAFDAAVAHFVDCLLSGREFETEAQSNLRTLGLVDASRSMANKIWKGMPA